MLGHLSTDINQGALPALLPFLIAAHGFSYTEAAFFVLASNMISAIIQPLFGWLGDRVSKPWFMAAGVLLASAGFAGIGFVQSYYVMLALACVSGIGVALYHPEGGRLANLASGKTKGKGISIFSVGGNLGFAIGPILVVAGMALFGLKGTALTMITGGISAAILLSQNKMLAALSKQGTRESVRSGEQDDVRSFAIALIPVFMRSIVYYAEITFIPLFFVSVLGATESFSSLAITFFSIVSVMGTVLGGPLGDRVGYVRVMVVSYLLLTPIVVLFALNRIMPIALLLMAAMSLITAMITPCSTVTTQRFLPQHLGTASGITFGVAVSVGGVMSPVFGAIGDAFGLTASMLIVGGMAAVGSAGTFFVPREKRKE
ncbi:MAG: MFS transporter [Eggerthellaceae bacterium]